MQREKIYGWCGDKCGFVRRKSSANSIVLQGYYRYTERQHTSVARWNAINRFETVTSMNLLQKLNCINTPRVSPLESGSAQTLEEFWNRFIAGHLPSKAVVLHWHKVLMEYVTRPNAVFAIRGYNAATKDNYDRLRRGFLTRTNAGYSFFYTDNFHAAYYLKMAADGYVPTVDEMIAAYNMRLFPARFGRDTSYERDLMAMPKGKDPGIQRAGYKIAHILNVGKDYYVNGEAASLSRIIARYFDGGQRSDWTWHTDQTGAYYLRSLEVPPAARKYLVAEFLRFVHPFNYFLAPKKTCSHAMVCTDIAEYPPLVDYVQYQFSKRYGAAYQDYLALVMTNGPISGSVPGSTRIDVKYALDLAGDVTPRKVENPAAPKATSLLQGNQSSENGAPRTKNVEFRIVMEYLVNPDTSFRKLERQFMGIDSRTRGGGFQAKRIVNSYGITAEMKGILSRYPIAELMEKATGQLRAVLLEIEKKR